MLCVFCSGPHQLGKESGCQGLADLANGRLVGNTYTALRVKDKCFVFDDKKTESVEEHAQGNQRATLSRI